MKMRASGCTACGGRCSRCAHGPPHPPVCPDAPLQMCKDRGYEVGPKDLVMSLEEFKSKFCAGCVRGVPLLHTREGGLRVRGDSGNEVQRSSLQTWLKPVRRQRHARTCAAQRALTMTPGRGRATRWG